VHSPYYLYTINGRKYQTTQKGQTLETVVLIIKQRAFLQTFAPTLFFPTGVSGNLTVPFSAAGGAGIENSSDVHIKTTHIVNVMKMWLERRENESLLFKTTVSSFLLITNELFCHQDTKTRRYTKVF